MNVKRFSAATSREALHKLRDAMGPDAVIISNRNVNGQVEILALDEGEMADLHETANEFEFIPPRKQEAATNPIIQSQTKFAIKKKQNEQSLQMRDNPIEVTQPSSLSNSLPSANAPDMSGALELMSELRSMRGMMETQLAEINWGNTQRKEPHKAQLLREMLSTGFSASLSRYLIENMPKTSDLKQGLIWIKAILSKNLNTISCDSDMLEQGGVFALVGPTGVGKTTTTAKLAARCVMRHGASKLALITTDGYRIGGYEQLRIYGKILGVMVHAVKDEADLRIALSELKNKHTVLIDTVGMSQRDRLVAEQVAMLSGANVNKLLCLNATSTGETLTEVIRSYQGAGLYGCIITKMDEAANIGAVLDAIIRQKLTMFYLANGQRVPEDLHIANKHYLVEHAFKLKREQAAFQFQDDELPMLMATASAAMHDRQLREVSLG
ncbi:flagellar biosynthesis protein FlhF [Solimicrobium silvestre]|uniref:Flagellar biosynthesis protein FlhF n=1 Tax=Solimicrobium silvestre TaxID=2099400 RepID=A0A2S9GVV2_9BURK|nr:flagellar biosynthesis protein FlhF [Solimicrobium silvestre]PRC91852.1 FlhF: flagellar biosynthesis protein FlhF [Solimicrobium silvestre]